MECPSASQLPPSRPGGTGEEATTCHRKYAIVAKKIANGISALIARNAVAMVVNALRPPETSLVKLGDTNDSSTLVGDGVSRANSDSGLRQ